MWHLKGCKRCCCCRVDDNMCNTHCNIQTQTSSRKDTMHKAKSTTNRDSVVKEVSRCRVGVQRGAGSFVAHVLPHKISHTHHGRSLIALVVAWWDRICTTFFFFLWHFYDDNSHTHTSFTRRSLEAVMDFCYFLHQTLPVQRKECDCSATTHTCALA